MYNYFYKLLFLVDQENYSQNRNEVGTEAVINVNPKINQLSKDSNQMRDAQILIELNEIEQTDLRHSIHLLKYDTSLGDGLKRRLEAIESNTNASSYEDVSNDNNYDFTTRNRKGDDNDIFSSLTGFIDTFKQEKDDDSDEDIKYDADIKNLEEALEALKSLGSSVDENKVIAVAYKLIDYLKYIHDYLIYLISCFILTELIR